MSVSKIVAAAASSAGGAGLDVDEVFSTFLYDGTGSARNIVNDINMADNGGLVWIKSRTEGGSQYDGFHILCDSERGVNKTLNSDSSKQENWTSFGNTVTGFNNTNGFSIGDSDYVNYNGHAFASWTFRKAKKFFDIVTYTGSGSHPRNVSHNLGSAPGMILVKNLGDGTEDWIVYHRGVDSSAPEDYGMFLNLTDSRVNNDAYWGDTAPTSTTFTVGGNITNQSGENFIAYVFAHNDGDGDFGADGDADIIKCGSYTGTQSRQFIDLGFEPQWVLVKPSSTTGNWTLLDTMRGWSNGSTDATLYADGSFSEGFNDYGDPSATGFYTASNGNNNVASQTYIYIAIRRGTKAPESATEVFAIDTPSNTTPVFVSGFTPDMGFWRYTASTNTQIMSRITGQGRMYTNLTNASSNSSSTSWDYQNGWFNDTSIYGQSAYSWMWKRAPGFFDVVAYTGNGVQGRNITHNLGVAPDMIWVKNRDDSVDWAAYVSGITHLSVFGSDPDNYGDNPVRLELNTTEQAQFSGSGNWDHTHPTDTVFRVGDTNATNGTGDSLIAYLFASLPGISKVGSYTGNGTSQNIDCGFTSGARFVLIKNVSQSDNWMVYDSVRGIVSGNDPYLRLNSTAAEYTSGDHIDPYSGGFAATSNDPSTNRTGNTYIFYAIA